MKNGRNLISMASLAFILLLAGCKDEPPAATVSFNSVGSDLGGDVIGEGGDVSQTNTWNNSKTTADWNMDITSASGGSFQLIVKDADGVTVLDNTLIAGQGDDSGSGVTSAGTAGDWSVTVILTGFNGDGSFSLSPGT